MSKVTARFLTWADMHVIKLCCFFKQSLQDLLNLFCDSWDFSEALRAFLCQSAWIGKKTNKKLNKHRILLVNTHQWPCICKYFLRLLCSCFIHVNWRGFFSLISTCYCVLCWGKPQKCLTWALVSLNENHVTWQQILLHEAADKSHDRRTAFCESTMFNFRNNLICFMV